MEQPGLLVSVAELASHLDDPGWIVVDCRFDLQRPDAGRELHARAHIPGAVFADLDRDLSGPKKSDLGRHPLPDPEALRRLFSSLGISAGTQVVAYDDSNGALAARLWWLLRWMGHTRVALLDGGLAAWKAAGHPLDDRVPTPEQGHFAGEPGGMPVISTPDLVDALADEGVLLLDVRAPERFAGRTEPIDPVAGHVPGAVNAPFSGNLDDAGRFRPPADLAKRYRALLGSRSAGEAVLMCGSGVTACHAAFSMERAGLPGARLYAGSWSEWIRDPRRPVVTEASS